MPRALPGGLKEMRGSGESLCSEKTSEQRLVTCQQSLTEWLCSCLEGFRLVLTSFNVVRVVIFIMAKSCYKKTCIFPNSFLYLVDCLHLVNIY